MTDNNMNGAANAANIFVAEQLAQLGQITQKVRPETAEKITKAFEEVAAERKAEPKVMLSKLQLAQIIEAQVKKQLDRFKEEYNKRNTASYIDFRIVLSEGVLRRDLGITMTLDGESSLLFGTRYGFSKESQIKDEGEWKLTLWNEALYNIVGGCIAFGMEIAKQRKQANNG